MLFRTLKLSDGGDENGVACFFACLVLAGSFPRSDKRGVFFSAAEGRTNTTTYVSVCV